MTPPFATNYFAFYGSLRRGMQNHRLFEAGLMYVHSVWLRGYKMFALDDYPCVVKADSTHKILVEVMQTTDPEWATKIHQLEIEAGYMFETVSIGNRQAVLYFFETIPNDRWVQSGDWVTFFRESGRF
jgi:gamma-glutamylcyclotransferase (GGCT)/AIG2-like uncharacterized protein YtfP